MVQAIEKPTDQMTNLEEGIYAITLMSQVILQ